MSLQENCRCCYKEIVSDDQNFYRLPDQVTDINMTLYEVFVFCTGLQMPDEDIKLGVSCKICTEEMLAFHNFKQQVYETTERFNSRLKMVESEDTIIKMDVATFDEEWLEEEQLHIKQDKEEPKFQEKPKDKPSRRNAGSTRKEYQKNEEGFYECPNTACGGVFKSIGRLELHLEVKHPDTDQTSFPCDLCDDIFVLYQQLKKHNHDVHTPKPYICELCGKQFAALQDIRGHMRAFHLKLKSKKTESICTICKKVFLL